MQVINHNYGTCYDRKTGVSFVEMLVNGYNKGVADVDESVAETFRNRPGFEVVGAPKVESAPIVEVVEEVKLEAFKIKK